ncbi:hypothetical protein ACFPM7_11910 [Actinokineospora guangxiensis]|uniref:Beta-ketoacyl synthase-like protein n=1 Tax=Actinokineospora guangxiensis TaxID=1490288 RepID=A0ABW0EK27_9PSEU
MVSRSCASGMDAVAIAAARVRAGDAPLLVAGGVQSVSRVAADSGPLRADVGVVRRVGAVEPGVAADLSATIDGFGRAELVRPATTAGTLAALPPAYTDAGADGQDELALSTRAWPGRVEHRHTAGTSPPPADAAALLLIGDERAARRLGIAPRARITATAVAAHDLVTALTAGQEAMAEALRRAGLRPAGVDVAGVSAPAGLGIGLTLDRSG